MGGDIGGAGGDVAVHGLCFVCLLLFALLEKITGVQGGVQSVWS